MCFYYFLDLDEWLLWPTFLVSQVFLPWNKLLSWLVMFDKIKQIAVCRLKLGFSKVKMQDWCSVCRWGYIKKRKKQNSVFPKTNIQVYTSQQIWSESITGCHPAISPLRKSPFPGLDYSFACRYVRNHHLLSSSSRFPGGRLGFLWLFLRFSRVSGSNVIAEVTEDGVGNKLRSGGGKTLW